MSSSGITSNSEQLLPWTVRTLWLLGPVLILGLAAVLQVGPGRRVSLVLGKVPLPESCAAYSILGVDCPGCGLTRTFVHLMHADVAAAWKLNPVGIVLFVYVIAQIPIAAGHWLAPQQRRKWIDPRVWRWWSNSNGWMIIAIMLGLVVQWIFRVLGMLV